MTFGLRYIENGKTAYLLQISGDGRVLIIRDGRKFWIDPKDKPWEIFSGSAMGQPMFETKKKAEQAAANLLGQVVGLEKDVQTAFAGHNQMAIALAEIARGRDDNGRPLAAEDARQKARSVLIDCGLDWGHVLRTAEEFRRFEAEFRKQKKR